MSEYHKIPISLNLDPEEEDAIMRLKQTYTTFKKIGLENKFLENIKNNNLFIEYKKYILPKSDLLSPKSSKTYKEGNIMKGRSDLIKKGDKYEVETELKIKKGLEPKVKKALKKSVIEELDKRMEGGRFANKAAQDAFKGDMKGVGINIVLDSDSDSDYEGCGLGQSKKKVIPVVYDVNENIEILSKVPRNIRKLNPTNKSKEAKRLFKNVKERDTYLDLFGKGIKTYGDILNHLTEHITDESEPIDKRDYEQAKEIIDSIMAEKRKRGRPRKY
jgi:hypothetical protein